METPEARPKNLAAMESLDQFRELFELNPYPIFVVADDQTLIVNKAFLDLSGGVSTRGVIGGSILEHFEMESRHEIADLLRKSQGDPTPARPVRGLMRRLDGKPLEVEVTAAGLSWKDGLAVQAIVRDVTERGRLERDLHSIEKDIHTVMDKVSNFALFRLDAQGRVASWNLGAQRSFGYTAPEILQQQFEVLFTDEDRRNGAPARELSQASESGIARDERWHRRKDGRTFFVNGLLVAVRDDSGELTGFTKIAQDNTERKLAENALRESESRYRELSEQLEQHVAERTRHLEQSIQTWESFCYSIAHDLRAPLRTISGFAGALLEEYGTHLDPTGREYAERMMAAAQRMDEFIQDLLDFGRLAHADLPRREVDLEQIVRHALEELGPEIALSKAEVRLAVPFPKVYANAAALNQVITNLLTNAFKFVAPGGAPRVEIRAEDRSSEVRFWIQDHGIGINPEYHQQIFGLFERLHPRSTYPGTGVGLAIVQKAVERMGGQVGIESMPGQGSTFWVELPKPGPRS